MRTKQSHFRFTTDIRTLLEMLARLNGITMTAVLERLIREEAQRQGCRKEQER